MSTYLIADQNNENITVLRNFLLKFDNCAQIVHSNSGSDILPLVNKNKIDLCFINLNLSDSGSIDIAKELKKNTLTIFIPVILTGNEMDFQNLTQEIIESQADSILKFPLDELMFRLQLKTLLKLNKQLPEEISKQKSAGSKQKLKRLTELEDAFEKLKKSEAELKSNGALLRTILNSAPFEIWARDKNQIGILENDWSVKHFGSIIGKKPENGTTSPKSIKIWKSNNKRALSGEIIDEECVFDYRGELKDFHQIITPIISDNKIEGIAGFNIDITDKKLAEKSLIESEEKFHAVIEKSADGILIINDQGSIIELNNRLESITGYNRKNFIGTSIWDFQFELTLPQEKTKEYYSFLKGFIGQMLKSRKSEYFGKLGERKIKNANGQIKIIETTIYPVETKEKYFLVSVIRDITERKLFDEALKNSESKYYGIFDANKDGISIFVINPDDTISNFVEANKAAYEMLGYSKTEFLQMNVFDLEIDKASRSMTNRIDDLKKNKHINIETKLLHKNGQAINVDIIIVPIHYNNQIAIMNIVRDITERKKVDAELLESEKLYRNLVERLPDGVYKSTHDGKFIEVNPAMVKMLGYRSREELMAINIKSELYFEPEDRESIILQEKLEEMGIFRLKKKDGSEIWVEDHGWYTLDKDGDILFHEGIMRDITGRKMAEEILKESEERFKLLFEKAPISYQSLDENGFLIDVNETWLELMGYEKEEVISCWFGDFLTPEYVDYFKKQFLILKTSGKDHNEFEMIRKDGSIITVLLEGRVGHNPSGTFKQTHYVLSDITERRKAEKAIADERILLRTLIDNIPDLIYVKDTLGRKIISNKADLELMGFSDEKQVIGKTDLELYDLNFADHTYSDDLSVIRSANPIINKIELITNSKGEEKYISTSKIPLTNDSGEIIGLVGVGHDITKRRQTEQKLIQLSKGIEQSPASIIITDTNGNIEYVNPKLTEITGYTLEEIKGKNPSIFQSGYTTREEYEMLWKTISEGNEYRSEIQNRKRNGEIFWETLLISPIRDESGMVVNYLAIKEDISERKKTDLEIQKLSVAIEQNPASVIITNTQGIIEYVNKKFISISGYTKKELIGKVVRILKTGHTSDEIYVEIWNKLFAGQEWRGEHQNRTKKREKYWESVLISPIKNKEGKVTNFIILSEDISDRKKMEKDLITAKEKAEESDRLKSAFLANMSHEIRTPLNSILGFSDLLTDSDLDIDTRMEFANLINTSGTNLLSIINDVLDISKIEAGQIVLTNHELCAQKLISEIKKEYYYKANSKGVDLRLASDIPESDIIFRSDEMRIKQVMINFVGNAIKFTENGYIEIGVSLVNQTIRFHVKDTGIGISKEFHSSIFDRFRQVEASPTRKYGGNGLGLAITKNLAELLGGKIWLESEPNQGSIFYFALPKSFMSE
ncbi:MAG: PAS domain S-box protein [Prolixibacteraceae bacterium]|nr:PAS domain S-box protein [Prolixibacteraceae bacterium]